MSAMNVHLLNFHGPFTHIEILLEDTSTKPSSYYRINRWSSPQETFLSDEEANATAYLRAASSSYSFEIEANPTEVVSKWRAHHQKTSPDASILGHNCGVSVQWFLTEFAGIPAPHPFSTPISINHTALGLFIPSFVPFPVTLPGRIMSHAKFYIEARKHPELATQYTNLWLNTCLAVSALTMAISVTGIALASLLLSSGLSGAGVIAGCVMVGAVASAGFFATLNTRAAKILVGQTKKENDLEHESPSIALG